jgi:5-methylcytosine-specific restriction protein A
MLNEELDEAIGDCMDSLTALVDALEGIGTHAPLKPCPVPRCSALTTGGRCPAHARQADRARGSASQRLYGHAWHKARTAYLEVHPLCLACLREDVTTPASVVDHVVPHKGNLQLFWSEDNWRPLCARHHSMKTALHDGGFGHARQAVDNKGYTPSDRYDPHPRRTTLAPSSRVDGQNKSKGTL